MSFRNQAKVFILAAALGLSGCLKDHAPLDQIKIGDGISGCLNDFDQTIRDYFGGRADPKAVSSLFDCSVSALDLFMKHTRGEVSGTYLPEELRLFLQRYFLKD